MVLAHARETDVTDQHHLIAFFGGSDVQCSVIGSQAGAHPSIHPGDSPGRVHKTRAIPGLRRPLADSFLPRSSIARRTEIRTFHGVRLQGKTTGRMKSSCKSRVREIRDAPFDRTVFRAFLFKIHTLRRFSPGGTLFQGAADRFSRGEVLDALAAKSWLMRSLEDRV